MGNFNITIDVKILDDWEELNSRWNYINYVLCEIAGTVYLLEKEL